MTLIIYLYDDDFDIDQDALENGNMTAEESLDFLKGNLSDEARSAMDELLKQGYTMEEVINLFKKHGNNLGAIDNELVKTTVEFGAESADAHLYADRDAFSVISKEEIEAKIPFMTPAKQPCSFKQFIEKVKALVADRGLTHREILGRFI